MVHNKTVKFTHYRHKQLWYITECGFEFPLPIEDIGDATFAASDKTILLMRYIRQHLNTIEAAKQQN